MCYITKKRGEMRVAVDFECGEIYCASSLGVACRFHVATGFGTRHFCTLFYDDMDKRSFQRLEMDAKHGVVRCEQCLNISEDKNDG